MCDNHFRLDVTPRKVKGHLAAIAAYILEFRVSYVYNTKLNPLRLYPGDVLRFGRGGIIGDIYAYATGVTLYLEESLILFHCAASQAREALWDYSYR